MRTDGWTGGDKNRLDNPRHGIISTYFFNWLIVWFQKCEGLSSSSCSIRTIKTFRCFYFDTRGWQQLLGFFFISFNPSGPETLRLDWIVQSVSEKLTEELLLRLELKSRPSITSFDRLSSLVCLSLLNTSVHIHRWDHVWKTLTLTLSLLPWKRRRVSW